MTDDSNFKNLLVFFLFEINIENKSLNKLKRCRYEKKSNLRDWI